ncbi:MAG: ABC transporter permease [Gammaproteobacteria bacterium GWE2_37_16]|nr:MAG: ABC transporter permease [Gammaproteobacteria bacterium GWE2_37_16]
MNALQTVALKLLFNDKGKFFTLIIGIMFAVLLMMLMTATFTGIIQKTSSQIINLNADMWVMDPSVDSTRDNIPIPDYVLDAVRSIQGVKFAVPLYSGSGLVKLSSGRYQATQIVGIDDSTLFGRPQIIDGNINAIFNDDAFIAIKDSDFSKLDSPKNGTTFEVNDHRGIIVGTGKVSMGGLFGTPTLYTLYSRAIKDLPTTRFTISYILLNPKNTKDISYIKQEVTKLGYKTWTRQEFIDANSNYYMFKTGLGTNIVIMTLVSFIVGLSVAGQTFYAFVLENLEKFGALKAIGAKKRDLMEMIFFQAAIVGFLGYGFGVFASSTLIALAKLRLPNYASVVTFPTMIFSFFLVLIIVSFSSYIGIRKILKIEPFDIFRG